MRVVDGIEAHEGGEEAPVGLGDVVAVQVAAAGEPRLEPVERPEQCVHGMVVGRLASREPALVDAVVDVRVDLALELVDLRPQRLRVEIEPHVGERVELAVQHPDDLGRLVVDDAVRLPVEQHRHRDVMARVRLGQVVDLREELEAVDRIEVGARRAGERPAALVADRIDDRERDRLLEPLQATHDDRAVGPRAGERDVQVVAARGRG